MAVIHIPEEEAVRDLKALLDRVDNGDEIVIDRMRKSVRMAGVSPTARSREDIQALSAKKPPRVMEPDEDAERDYLSFRERHRDGLDGSKWD